MALAVPRALKSGGPGTTHIGCDGRTQNRRKRRENLTPQGPAVNFVSGHGSQKEISARRRFAHFGAMQQAKLPHPRLTRVNAAGRQLASFPAMAVAKRKPEFDFGQLRDEMVEHHIAARGVRSDNVLKAMRKVKREAFLPAHLHEFAYEDSPLPIAEGQTISQPYIVALMIEALALDGGETVLEIGTGSGYAAAVLGEIARDVYSVERIGQLAEKAAAALAEQGYDNVHVLHGDGTRGWPEHAPYDAIVVAAGGPKIPDSLRTQLKIGGRLVIPVGSDARAQELVRVTRVSENDYRREDLADVRFVPLLGQEGWEPNAGASAAPCRQARATPPLERAIAKAAEAFDRSKRADLVKRCSTRIGDARVVLLGEATHGSSRILPDARGDLARTDSKERLQFHRHRRRLARRRAHRSLCAAPGISAVGVDGVCPLPDLDVAQ